MSVRASVLAGTVRVRKLIDAVVRGGDVVVDVGANVGCVAACAAARVGAGGRVFALEPAEDNLVVLRENLCVNRLSQVEVLPVAAGATADVRQFFVRGELSAVNSLFPESCYAAVTRIVTVPVVPLDTVVSRAVRLVKIDVEGAELDVLSGMPALLHQAGLHLVVEWHPLLQQAAGRAADELPRWLLAAGFVVHGLDDWSVRPVMRHDVPRWTKRLLARRRPIELWARRPVGGACAGAWDR